MRSAILNRLPDRFLAVAFAGVDRDVEVFTLDIVKSGYMFFRRIAAFLSRQIETHHSAGAKVHVQPRHFERDIHISHGTDDQSRSNSKFLASALQPFQYSGNHLLM